MKKIVRNRRLVIATAFALGALLIGGGLVHADQFDVQINKLAKQNAASQVFADQYAAQAKNYQDAVNRLQEAINSLQNSINAKQKQISKLQVQINEAQVKLNYNRKLLAQSILTLYQQGQTSTFEILASSTDLSDFVNRQQYQSAVQDKVKETFDQITQLKASLLDKQQQLKSAISDLRQQQQTKAAAQSKENTLLSYSASQRDAYNNRIQANNNEIASLREQQAAAIAAATGSNGNSSVGSSVVFSGLNYSWCGGGYSYCSHGFDQYDSATLAAWGLEYDRECVHYVADTLSNRGYYIPAGLFSGRGNAYQWVGTTTSTGTATLVSDPQKNDVVYLPIGTLGHVAIVDYVNSDGTLHVSQMNWPYGGWYSTMNLTVTSNLQFLRFHK